MKILVIEDEVLLADSLKALLTGNGFEVECVYNGEDGAAYAGTGIYDLLILDVMMPGLNGYEVARRVRKERCGVPILMLTAKTELEDEIEGLDAGADGASAPGGEAGDGTMSRKMAQDEAARPEMAMEESPDADGEAVSISPLDPEPALTGDSDGANIEMELTDGSGNSSYYRNRLAELENRIQKNREAQTASNNSNSAKTLADSELKLWDNELNLIYNAVKDDLDDGEAADLVGRTCMDP